MAAACGWRENIGEISTKFPVEILDKLKFKIMVTEAI